MDKSRRQQLIRDIISSRAVSSQNELVTSLKKRGLAVTQATVSRDITELGLTKARNLNGRVIYQLVGQTALAPSEKLTRALEDFALTVDGSENLVVVKTSPGAAQTVARGIDEANMTEILGTVAGDDTILIIARSKEKGRGIARLLRRMMRISADQ